MSLRLVLTLLPAVVGWAIGIYLQLRAVQHLRTQRPVIRVTAFLLGPFGGPLYTLEGFRYRGLALLSAYTGLALTARQLQALVRRHPPTSGDSHVTGAVGALQESL